MIAAGGAGRAVPADRAADRQVQLAVVLTGGVSLAVWMGGVVTELQRLVRADGPYARLCALTGTRVDVDVIGGSSAGGINGAVLALALAAGTDATAVRDIWIRDASLSALLRDPRTDPDCVSLLRGDDYFLPRLQEAFAALTGAPVAAPADGLELILTGTLLDGVTVTRTDDFGSTFTDTYHQAEFRFARDAGGGPDDFADPAAAGKLALAARATSSFPGAFEPTLCPVGPGAGGVDLGPHVNFPTSRYVIDGGVLVNKPLRPVLDAVLAKGRGREAERVICYIQPAPDDEDAYGTEAAPSLGRVLEAGWFALPHAQSLARELAELARHNAGVRDRRDRLRQLLHSPPGEVVDRARRVLADCRGAEPVAALPDDERGLDAWSWTEDELARTDDLLHLARAEWPGAGPGAEPAGPAPTSPAQRQRRAAEALLARLPPDHPVRGCAAGGRALTATRRWLLAAVVVDTVQGGARPPATGPMRLLYVSAEAPNGLDARRRPAEKLAGLQLRHFGAFYKSAWRANDWMWGRLDASARLVQLLLDPAALAERAGRVPGFAEQCLAAVRAIAGADGAPPPEGFDEDAVRAELAFLRTGGPVPDGLPLTQHLVTRSLHLDVVAEELPRVAAAQQDDARRGHRPPPAGSPQTPLPGGATDAAQLVAAFAACRLGEDRLGHDRGSAVYEELLDRTAHLTLRLAARRPTAARHRARGRVRHGLAGSTPLLRGARAAFATQRWPLALAPALCLAGLAEIGASAHGPTAQLAAVGAGFLLAIAGLLVAGLVARRFKAVVAATAATTVACAGLALVGPLLWRVVLGAVIVADLGISARRRRRRPAVPPAVAAGAGA